MLYPLEGIGDLAEDAYFEWIDFIRCDIRMHYTRRDEVYRTTTAMLNQVWLVCVNKNQEKAKFYPESTKRDVLVAQEFLLPFHSQHA